MLHAADESDGEGIGIRDPRGRGPAIVKLIAWSQPVNAQLPLLRVELRWILTAGDAPLVRFLGYPAFVADVGVAAGCVHRGDDPGCLR